MLSCSQELAQRLKAQLSFFSSEEIDRKIKVLEHQQQTCALVAAMAPIARQRCHHPRNRCVRD